MPTRLIQLPVCASGYADEQNVAGGSRIIFTLNNISCLLFSAKHRVEFYP